MILELFYYFFTLLYDSLYDAIINFKPHHIFIYLFYISIILYCWRTLIQIYEHIFPPKPGDPNYTPSQQEQQEKQQEMKGEWLDDDEEEEREEGGDDGDEEHDHKDGLINRKNKNKIEKFKPVKGPPPPLPPRTHPKHRVDSSNNPGVVPVDPAVSGTLSLLRTHVVDVISFHEFNMKKSGPGTLFINVDMATGASQQIIMNIWKTHQQPSDWEGPGLYLNADQVLRTGDEMAIAMLKSYDPTCEMIWILYRTEQGTYQPQQTWSYRIAYDKQDKTIYTETTKPDVPL